MQALVRCILGRLHGHVVAVEAPSPHPGCRCSKHLSWRHPQKPASFRPRCISSRMRRRFPCVWRRTSSPRSSPLLWLNRQPAPPQRRVQTAAASQGQTRFIVTSRDCTELRSAPIMHCAPGFHKSRFVSPPPPSTHSRLPARGFHALQCHLVALRRRRKAVDQLRGL